MTGGNIFENETQFKASAKEVVLHQKWPTFLSASDRRPVRNNDGLGLFDLLAYASYLDLPAPPISTNCPPSIYAAWASLVSTYQDVVATMQTVP